VSDQQSWIRPGDGGIPPRPPAGPAGGPPAPPDGPAARPGDPGGPGGPGGPPPPGWGQGPAAGGWGGPAGPGPAPAPVLRPGIVPLRPLSLGEIYDGAFQALRTNPRTMLGVTAVVVTLLTVVDSLIRLTTTRGLQDLPFLSPTGEVELGPGAFDDVAADVGTALGGLLASVVLQSLAIAVVTGLLTLSVSQGVLGRRLPLDELWGRTRRRVPALVGLSLVVLAAIVAAVVAAVLPGLALTAAAGPVGAVLLVVGVPAAIVAAAYLYTRLSLATPALMLEEATVRTALRRSWLLVRGSSWRVFGILLLTGIITMLTVLVVTAPFGVVSTVLSLNAPDDPLAALSLTWPQLLVTGIGTIVASTIVYPFTASVTALLYVDLRMRREGLDVQLAQAAQEPPAPGRGTGPGLG
jgi:hypothetical protein